VAPVTMRRPCTEDEIKLARKMRAAGHSYDEIDWALRRRADTTNRRHEGVVHRHAVRSSRDGGNDLTP
jgi:hypothetical protein